jgi:hypothetical protein
MPSHLGYEPPRETNAIEVIDEDAKVLLLELTGITQRLASVFSLGLKNE